jgi:hypothetical protein
VSAELADVGVAEDERPAWLELRAKEWSDGRRADGKFADVVAAALKTGDPVFGRELAESYFDMHHVLVVSYLMSHDEARAFLSHARLMAALAKEEHASAAQIARMLAARDRRVPFTWRSVQQLLGRTKCKPQLILEEVQALWADDAAVEQALFADADACTSAQLLGRAGITLGFDDDLESHALALYPTDGSVHGPYLQILHFVCTIAEFYDHALSYGYEFAPRGKVAKWVFDQYPPTLAEAGNPMLNNAKGVDRLDLGWAQSRDERLEQAQALASVISGLEEMGFAARQELAAWLRRWLHHVFRLVGPLKYRLPTSATAAQVRQLIAAVQKGETATHGIVEQRVVDAAGAYFHRGLAWRARGVGDSVNASNLSRRKLGDCDFQDAVQRSIESYEAHAGVLTELYFEGHSRTLQRALALRIEEELKGIAEPSRWTVLVTFVAHGFTFTPPPPQTFHGVRVEVKFVTYEQLFKNIRAAQLKAAVNAHVLAPLNAKRTPEAARRAVLAAIGR